MGTRLIVRSIGLACAALFALSLAGCGSCCQEDTSSTSQAPSATGSEASTPTTVIARKPADTTPMPIELKVVKYPELGKAIRALKGNVVIVDVWATWCPPCVKEFPHLVELHAKYASAGLVCISVSMNDKDTHADALEFLTKKKAHFVNYRLDEVVNTSFDRLDIKGIPVVYLFDRDNKRAAKFTNDDPDKPFSYEKDVTPLVRQLLDAKK